jgi:hypothetical protein
MELSSLSLETCGWKGCNKANVKNSKGKTGGMQSGRNPPSVFVSMLLGESKARDKR